MENNFHIANCNEDLVITVVQPYPTLFSYLT